MFYYFIIVSCFHLSLASWLLFSNKVQLTCIAVHTWRTLAGILINAIGARSTIETRIAGTFIHVHSTRRTRVSCDIISTTLNYPPTPHVVLQCYRPLWQRFRYLLTVLTVLTLNHHFKKRDVVVTGKLQNHTTPSTKRYDWSVD